MCVSYYGINRVMLPCEYYIGRCDAAIENLGDECGIFYFICPDKAQEYHQISVKLSDREKLTFFRRDGLKYTFKVIPFGHMNTPAFYTSMIRQFQDEWIQLFRLLCNKKLFQYSFATSGQRELVTTSLPSTYNYLMSCTSVFLPNLEVDE